MIKSKSDVNKLLAKEKKVEFMNSLNNKVIVKYNKEKEVSIIEDNDKSVNIRFINIVDALAILYKERKYINKSNF